MSNCTAKRVLTAPPQLCAVGDKVGAARGFDFPTQLVGKGAWTGSDGQPVTVYCDPSLGQSGLAVAQNVLSRIDALMAYCDLVFGIRGLGGNVIIAAVNGARDGSGGAYHYGCGFGAQGGDWYEDVAVGNPDLTFGLVMAEVCESYMGLQNRGWNCGGSGGEGLSRFLAEIVSGGPAGALSGFSSGASWDGTDWISRDQGTDGDYPSIGAAVLYCWWMTALGWSIAQLVQAGEPDGTLASNYYVLTGKPKAQAFADFRAAVASVGGPGGFQGDNPFHAPVPVYPPAVPVPPVPTPTPTPPPPPSPTVLFTKTFTRAVSKGGPVWFNSPTTIPTGSKLAVFLPTKSIEGLFEDTLLD